MRKLVPPTKRRKRTNGRFKHKKRRTRNTKKPNRSTAKNRQKRKGLLARRRKRLKPIAVLVGRILGPYMCQRHLHSTGNAPVPTITSRSSIAQATNTALRLTPSTTRLAKRISKKASITKCSSTRRVNHGRFTSPQANDTVGKQASGPGLRLTTGTGAREPLLGYPPYRVKLTTVNIKNYRCLADVSVDMTDLTVLLGPNSAGKSSFLHALAFFFENTSLDAADVFGGEDQTTSVECIFGDLTDTDRVALGPYALGSQVVLRRSWTPGGDSVLTGRGRRFPRFEEVRSKTGREFTAAYKSLRDELAHPDLPEAKNVTAVEQAMLTFEQEHPDLCEVVEDANAGKFLGFGSVGKSKVEERFPFVMVPAMRDAASDAVERRGTC